MDLLTISWRLVLALLIGAIIGLERETQNIKNKKQSTTGAHNVGVRTFGLITTLGCIAGFMYYDHLPVFIALTTVFSVILLIYYFLHSTLYKDTGFTTELAIIFSYFLGFFLANNILPIQIVIAMAVILTLILARKREIQVLLKGIQREELNAFVSYGLIALVILPFLPNEGYTLGSFKPLISFLNSYNIDLRSYERIEIINPFKLWFIVVLITGVDLIGYTLERVIGRNRGKLITSIVGGFVSSTATTISLAQESKSSKKGINTLVGAAVFANVASFFQVFLLTAPINSQFLISATPTLLAIILSGIIAGTYLFLHNKESQRKTINNTDIKIDESDIFSVGPALKFALLFLGITIMTRFALVTFGQAGFLISSSLAAVTGLDAIIINIAELAGKTIEYKLGVFTLILVNAVNLFAKVIYSFIEGKKEFAIKFTIVVLIIIASSFIGVLFL